MVQIVDKGGKIYVTHINIRQSIFFLLLKLIILDIMVAILAIGYFFLVSNDFALGIFGSSMPVFNLTLFLLLIILKIVLSIYIALAWINEYYEIWPGAIIHKNGFILRREEKHPLSQMRSVRIEQDFFGKMFGFGTIYLYNWYLKKNTVLYLIHNPVKYYRIIGDLIPKSEKEREIFLDEASENFNN